MSIGSASDVEQIGAIVGQFDRIMETFDHGFGVGQFRLPLFDNDEPTEPGLTRYIAVRRQLIDRDADATRRLPVQTIYHDWHPWNLVSMHGRPTGLIDFDSLVEAPAIADCVNALSYCLLLSKLAFEPVRDAFFHGYDAQRAISPEEKSIGRTLLIDRLLLPANQLGTHAQSRREALLDWIVQRDGV
jgi:Ser/Thr protein kinase RdoA (MazF antagonist)